MHHALVSSVVWVLAGLWLTGCVSTTAKHQTAVVFANSAADAKAAVLQAGGAVTHELPIIDAVGATVSERHVSALSSNTDIGRIIVSDAQRSTAPKESSVSSAVSRWLEESLANSAVNAALSTYLDDANRTLTGSGIGIAIIDTGFSEETPEVHGLGPLTLTFNALTNDSSPITDITGHGTHLVSLVKGVGDSFSGVAPDANIIMIKAFDEADTANSLDIIRAVQWVLDHREQHNIRILNLSISAPTDLPYFIDPLNMALTTAWHKGLVVVVSAGNDGPNLSSITAPGNNPWLITVGAADDSEDLGWYRAAPFSGRGPTQSGHIKPDLLAPGTALAGLRPADAVRPANEPGHFDAEGFWIANGSSQASVVASGMIARLLEARPQLSNHDVKCLLANTAIPLKGDRLPFDQGRGFINLKSALSSSAVECEERLEGMDPETPLEGSFKSK